MSKFSKNVALILLCIIIMFLLISCDSKIYHWEFEKDYTEVESIQIIDIYGNPDQYNVIKELDIAEAKTLFDEIEKLDMKRYGGALMAPYRTSILIVFQNGEYDIISRIEPAHFRYDSTNIIQEYTSWRECDEEQFNNLINKYLDSSPN